MKVVFKNNKEPVEANLQRYECENCKVTFRWEENCYSRLIIDGYNDIYKCLCPKCSKEYERQNTRE